MAWRRWWGAMGGVALVLSASGVAAQMFAPDQPRTPRAKGVGAERIKLNRRPTCRPARLQAYGASRQVVVLAHCNDLDVEPLVVVRARTKQSRALTAINEDQSVTVVGLDPGEEVELDVDVADVRGKGTKVTFIVFRAG